MMRGRRHRTVAVALVVGVLAAAAAGAPAAGWQPPVSTPPATNAIEDVDVGVDAQGNAVAVWTLASIHWRRTQAATRPLGGTWSTPVTFEVPDERSGWNPRVAVGANGDAVAVWSSTRLSDPDRQLTMAATRDAGGAWSEPVTLSLQGEDDFGVTVEPVVVVDAQGTATAMWCESTGGEGRVIRTRTRPRGGAWSEPQELTPSEQDRFAATPQLAVDAQGDVTAVWTWRLWPSGSGIIQSARRAAGGVWSTPVDVSDPDLEMNRPQVALNAQGDPVAVWQSPWRDGPGVQAARWTAADGWGPVADLSGPGGRSPQAAIDPQGTATAVWETIDDDGRHVHASTSDLGGAWSAPVELSVSDDATSQGATPKVTTDPQGDVTVIWTNLSEGFNRVTAVRREGGGAWSMPVQVGQGSLWSAAPDPQGYVTALWTQGSQTQIHSSVFDAVAPALQTVTVPASGVVGQSVAMSVVASDLWSSVTARWDFGDGGSAVGASVARCYSTPGTRTVTVTGTDGAGNATSAQRTIDVDPDPALAPGEDPCAQRPDPPRDPPDPPNPPGPGDPPNPPGPGDPPNPPGDEPATAPRVSGLQQTAARWRIRAVDRRPRLPVGTTFRFQLDRAADIRLAFVQTVTGRRVAARCVKATKANRGKPRCSSSRPRGTLSLSGAAGANAYAFRGRVRNRTLAPGRYRLHVTALRDGKSSNTATIAFTVAG